MSKSRTVNVRVTRWRGGQHPTQTLLKRQLEQNGLRPYKWSNDANYRYGVRSNGYSKSIYCLEGSVEVTLPDTGQTVQLRPGDRIDVGARVRHGINVGLYGATCLEGIPARQRR